MAIDSQRGDGIFGQQSSAASGSASTPPMAVAIVDPLGKHGGLHYYVEALANALANQGVRVLVYVTELTGVSGQEKYEPVVSFGQLYGPESALVRGWRFARGIVKAMLSARLNRAQMVNLHIFNFDARDAASVWLARLLGMKTLLTIHDVERYGTKGHRLLRRLTLAGASGYILHSQFCLEAFLTVEGKINKPVAIIPHGHYGKSFAHVPTRAEARGLLRMPEEPCTFLFFGNSRLEKGLDLLIEACGRLRRRNDWRLIIAGKMKPEQQAYYAAIVQAHDPNGFIRMDARFVPDEEAVAYYRAADLVVVPYRVCYESGVTIMAMTLGVAVLVSDLSPLVETIAQGRAGITFVSDNVDSLAAALVHAIEHRDQLDMIGTLGQKHVECERDWEKIGAATLQFLQQIVAGVRR
ncbi:MAG: glycosyltransferase family 4 protein [Formivibrio sp.]|nr:glycosyltransferase family 4 protein [Formivibrio sp.]